MPAWRFEPSEHFAVEGGTATKTHAWEGRTALGLPVLTAGRHVFHFVVEKLVYPDAHVFVGVAEEADSHCAAWGFNPPTGGLYIHKDRGAFGNDTRRKLMKDDLCGRQVGVPIEVRLDMDAKTLAFAVGGQAQVDTGCMMPDSVRPYAHMCNEGDMVALYEGPAPSSSGYS